MAGIKEIAKEANVSVSLVSKVLNNKMGSSTVRPEVAEKIRFYAKKYNYVANPIAKGLRLGKQNTIGVFLYRHNGLPGSGLFENFIETVGDFFYSKSMHVRWFFYSTLEELIEALSNVNKSIVDGVIVNDVPFKEAHEAIINIHNSGLKVVAISNDMISEEIPTVFIDQSQVAYLATKHLIEKGCKDILFIRHRNFTARYEGYKRALAEANIPLNQDLIYSVSTFTPQCIPQMIERTIAAKTKFDGVVTESDLQAVSVIRELLSRNIKVPKDVKVVGVDNSSIAQFGLIPLTSISGQISKRAKWAANALLDVINGETVENIMFEPILIERNSTTENVF